VVTPVGDRRVGDELTQLTGFLDAQRELLLRKASGLDARQLAQVHGPSTLTMGGLLNHGALNEDWWFGVRFAGTPQPEPWASADWDSDVDWEMTSAAQVEPDELRARYRDACARSRAIIEAASGLDALAVATDAEGGRWNLRWIVLHMIEETARHAGHADLIRESIDGETGE